jgi:hypothetical protein
MQQYFMHTGAFCATIFSPIFHRDAENATPMPRA